MVRFKKDNIGSDSKQFIKQDMYSRLKRGLSKTRDILTTDVMELIQGQQEIDENLLEQFEDQLMMADVGIDATQYISAQLSEAMHDNKLTSSDDMYHTLQSAMSDILLESERPLYVDRDKKPFVILMVGINGGGKTTTIGKLARKFKDSGLSVMLAAGDTYRAAAVEQLQEWGRRLDIQVVSQGKGADAASVVFDALQSAQSRKIDVLIADTAGRLHTQDNLMNELGKINKVLSKIDPTAPHETMLVLDAGTGQNALVQARHFNEAIGISGITLTKLDGTAKGGIVFSIARQLKLPIRYIGVGETAQDLRVFDSSEFIKALLSH